MRFLRDVNLFYLPVLKAQLQIDLSDEQAFVTSELDVISQRDVTLGFGRTYRIGCQDGTSPGMWNATIMISNSVPQDSSTTAAYLLDQGNKLVLRIQNFDASLAGEYICFSANGEQKRLIIVAGKLLHSIIDPDSKQSM